MLLCLCWIKTFFSSPALGARFRELLIEDYNWSEMHSGFPSVTLFGETSVKKMDNENRIRNPVCVAYVHLFNAVVFV